MNNNIKRRKKLHKVKKHWVIIGMTFTTLSGLGFIANQSNNLLSTKIVAHADNTSENYVADYNNVSISMNNLAESSVEKPLSTYKPIIYHINIQNTDNAGRVIPKGSHFKINFNTPNNMDLSNFLSFFNVYTQSVDGPTYSGKIVGNSIVITTEQDLYPGEYNLYVSMGTRNPGYQWNGDTPEHENHPDPAFVSSTASYDYNNHQEKSVKVNNGYFYIMPDKKINYSNETHTNTTSEDNYDYTSVQSRPYVDFKRPADPKYPAYSDPILVSKDFNTAQYTPIVTNSDGLPYVLVNSDFDGTQKIADDFSVETINILSNNKIDESHIKIYTQTDNGIDDITNYPGIIISKTRGDFLNIKAEGFPFSTQNGVIVNLANSKYSSHHRVWIVAYLPVTDLTKTYIYNVHSFGKRNGKKLLEYSNFGYSNLIMTDKNKGNPWIIAANKQVYTDKDGNVNLSLLDGVRGFSSDSTGTKFSKLDGVTVLDSDGLMDGINHLSSGSKTFVVKYQAKNENATAVSQRTITVINPFQKVNENIKSSVTVHYIDKNTGKEIANNKVQTTTFNGVGTRDTRNNSVSWESLKPVNGDGKYNINSISIPNYTLASDSPKTISGNFFPLVNNVDQYFKYVADHKDTSTDNKTDTSGISNQSEGTSPSEKSDSTSAASETSNNSDNTKVTPSASNHSNSTDKSSSSVNTTVSNNTSKNSDNSGTISTSSDNSRTSTNASESSHDSGNIDSAPNVSDNTDNKSNLDTNSFGSSTVNSSPVLTNPNKITGVVGNRNEKKFVPRRVYMTRSFYRYSTSTFHHRNRLQKYKKHVRPNAVMFKIVGENRNRHGLKRYKVYQMVLHPKTGLFKINRNKWGYITARHSYMRPLYYSRNVHKVCVISYRIRAYKTKKLGKYVRSYKHGTILRIKSIKKLGTEYRLQLRNGSYVSANKNLVKRIK